MKFDSSGMYVGSSCDAYTDMADAWLSELESTIHGRSIQRRRRRCSTFLVLSGLIQPGGTQTCKLENWGVFYFLFVAHRFPYILFKRHTEHTEERTGTNMVHYRVVASLHSSIA